MKVLVPFTIECCEADCKFWEFFSDSRRMCNFDIEKMKELPKDGSIPSWCSLREFVVKE